MKSLIKAAVVALVIGIVALLSVQLAIAMRVTWQTRGRVGITLVHLFGSSMTLTVLSPAVVASFVYCFFRFHRGRRLPVFILASLFSFGMVGGTAFAVLFLFVRDPQPSAAPLLPVLFFFSSCFAVVGFYGGIVGGSWLDLRSRQIHSTRRLLLESAGTGIAFGLAFACLVLLSPSYRAGSERSFHGLSLFLLLFLFGGFGCAISLIFAAAFRKRLVQ